MQFVNGEDIDGRPISGVNRIRRRRLFVQHLRRNRSHESLLGEDTIDACLGDPSGDIRFVLPDRFRKNPDVYQRISFM